MPASFDAGNGSLSHNAAASAPKNGLVALRMAAVDAAMYCPAKQNSANGRAELTMPTTRKSRQRSRHAGSLPRESARTDQERERDPAFGEPQRPDDRCGNPDEGERAAPKRRQRDQAREIGRRHLRPR
jgi:hypothetical protein